MEIEEQLAEWKLEIVDSDKHGIWVKNCSGKDMKLYYDTKGGENK